MFQVIVLDEMQRETLNDAPKLTAKEQINLSQKLINIQDRINAIDVNRYARLTAFQFSRFVSQQTNKQFADTVNKSIGIDISPILTDESMQLELDAAVQRNVALIKSIQNEYITEVGDVVEKAIFAGERSTTLISQIQERGKVSESRAKFIARDQTTKINAEISMLRAKKIGSDTYIWSGSMDERERPSHAVMEGLLCKVNDPTVYSNDNGETWEKRSKIGGVELHPGEDYGCRCDKLPVIKWD